MISFNIEKLQDRFETLEHEYKKNGTILWSDAPFDPKKYAEKIVEIYADDFKYGTLRIQAPCKIILKENIAFNPNRPEKWVKDYEKKIETTDFNEAIGLHPESSLDYYPNEKVMPNDRPSNKTLYFTGDTKNAYRLGFFAAIAIEANDVIIDLNGCTLSQHPEHALMQRFYSHIELADQPFLMHQGPAEFGDILRTSNNVLIKNGTLGLSAHHHIHGNDPTNILISDVFFTDAEIASVSLNGAKNAALIDCQIDRNRQDLPVLGSFSAARFGLKFTEAIISAFSDISKFSPLLTENKIIETYQNLKLATIKIFNDVIFGFEDSNKTLIKNKINLDPSLKNKAGQPGDPSHVIFQNPTGLIDGPSYGFLFHTKGVAINKFEESYDKVGMQLANVALIRCSVKSIRADIFEAPVFTDTKGKSNQVDVAGATIEFMGSYGGYGLRNDDGTYRGTVLSELQFALQRLKNKLPDRLGGMFGTLNVDPLILKWADRAFLKQKVTEALSGSSLLNIQNIDERIAEATKKIAWKLLPIEDTNTFGLFEADGKTLVQNESEKPAVFTVRFQGDFMHHVLKGILGIRIDGACGVFLEDVKVTEVENEGKLGKSIKPYFGPNDGGHENQSKMVGYFGNQSRGVAISASCNIEMNRVRVTNVKSTTGSAYGLVIQNDTNVVECKDIFINGVSAGTKYIEKKENAPYMPPNLLPRSCGLFIDQTSNDIECHRFNVGNDFKQPGPDEAKACTIHSKRIKIY